MTILGNSEQTACSGRLSETNVVCLTVLTSVKQLCIQKPGKVFSFNENVYNTTRIQIAPATTSGASSSTGAPASSQTSGSNNNSNSGSGISKGAIAGIVLGALIAIIIVLVAILLLLRRLRKRKEIKGMPTEMNQLNVPIGNYQYDPMTQSAKEHYSYQAGGSPLQTRGPIELETQREVTEMPTGPLSPTPRR
jgi:di/tricarboxylate transporter